MAINRETEENEYEAQRAANIAKNQALLKELQLNAASAGLGIVKSSVTARSTPDRSHKRKKDSTRAVVKKEQVDVVVPRRTSSRLAGLQADSEVAKRKAEEEHAAIQEAARIKRMRVSGDLNLAEVMVTGRRGWDKDRNVLIEVAQDRDGIHRDGMDAENVNGVEKATSERDLKDLRRRMNALGLYEGFEPNRIKITPERIYSMGFHPTSARPLVFAGDKAGNLGIFDASQSIDGIKSENDEDDDDDGGEIKIPEPDITAFKLHTRTVSSFVFPGSTGDTLLSASYDSSIRCLDLRASKSVEIYAPGSIINQDVDVKVEDVKASADDDDGESKNLRGRRGAGGGSGVMVAEEDDEEDLITCLDVPSSSPSIVYFSTITGYIHRHDMRTPPPPSSSPPPTIEVVEEEEEGEGANDGNSPTRRLVGSVWTPYDLISSRPPRSTELSRSGIYVRSRAETNGVIRRF